MDNSVTLDKERCKGCTTCIKQCPTQAIRVRRGRARILADRCIDCGHCIRVCPHHAKKAVCDGFERLKEFKYNIALPAPALYGQFHNLEDVNIVLQGLLDIGFDGVYEVSRGAEMISDLTRKTMADRESLPRPYISSACPAAVRLISLRFPELIKNIANHVAPVELSAIHAREEACEKTGLSPEEIGTFFITPCPAKVTSAHVPLGLKEPVISGSLSMTDIYVRLLGAMKKIKNPPQLSKSGIMGIGWASCGGEAAALLNERYLAVDGIENIIKILEDIEDEKLPEIDFIEINACTQGCVGGCLAVENPFAAKARIKRLMKYMPVSRNKALATDLCASRLFWDKELHYSKASIIGDTVPSAIENHVHIEKLRSELPGLDCGSCGAPTCEALAEDIVLGFASEDDCIFRMRERMQYMSGTGDADEYLPPPFRR